MSDRAVLVCPRCGKFQGLRKFGRLFVSSTVECDKCGTMVRYKMKSMQINAVLLGVLVACIGKEVSTLSNTEIVVISFFASFTIQRCIDVWSGLEVVPHDEL